MIEDRDKLKYLRNDLIELRTDAAQKRDVEGEKILAEVIRWLYHKINDSSGPDWCGRFR